MNICPSNRASEHAEVMVNNQIRQDESFGNWMIVQRNNRNRKPSNNRANESQGRILEKIDNPQRVQDAQKRSNATGSRFAIFDMEEECLEREENVEEQGV